MSRLQGQDIDTGKIGSDIPRRTQTRPSKYDALDSLPCYPARQSESAARAILPVASSFQATLAIFQFLFAEYDALDSLPCYPARKRESAARAIFPVQILSPTHHPFIFE